MDTPEQPQSLADVQEPLSNMEILWRAQQRHDQGLLPETELFWQEHYTWLKDSGYLLRSRYSPDRIPVKKPINIFHEDDEDIEPPKHTVADAIRISDGALVLLKKCDPASEHVPVYHEDRVLEMLSSGPLASDPSNRCIRMLNILPVPDDRKFSVIVLPFLYGWDLIPFSTVGEVVEFLSQVFEGLHFLHKNHIWHGDIKDNNILMDATPLLPEPAHPWRPRLTRNLARRTRFRNRQQHPVKYYLIDFDLSGVHDPSSGPPFMLTGYGGTRRVPEFAVQEQPCDPFPVDVYCLGNMIKVFFTEGDELYRSEKIPGFEFMQGLVANMMKEDPAKRSNMEEVVRRFDEIKGGLSGWKLRSRCAPVDESRVSRIFKSTIHWTRQFFYTVRRIPAIPTPS